MLTLARRFEGKLTLTPGEHEKDALAGCRRASPSSGRRCSAGRRWCTTSPSPSRSGASSARPPTELVELRKPLFEEVAHPHHYAEQRRIVDLVPEDALRHDAGRRSPRPTGPTGARCSATLRLAH